MRSLLLLVFLVTTGALRAQVTDTVQADADTLINPWTFFRRDNPGGLAYYFMRESKPGYPDVPAHWGRQDFPSRDSVRRMYPRHTPIAIADISTASLSALLKPFAHKDLVLEKEGVRLTFIDEEWVVLRTLEPAKGETQPAGYWQPLRVLSVNGGHKMISMGMHGFLVPFRDGRWLYFYNTYPETFALRDRPDSVRRFLAHYSYPNGIPLKLNGKQGLQTAQGRVLIPAQYDTLFANGYYYAARRGHRTELYYRNGDRHELASVRALRVSAYGTSALLDTGTVWLDHYGRPIAAPGFYKPGCGFMAFYRHQEIRRTDSGFVKTSIYMNNVADADTIRKRELLSNDPLLSEVRFITMDSNYTDHGMAVPYHWRYDVYLATFVDGSKAVVRFEERQTVLLTEPGRFTFTIVGEGVLRFEGKGGIGLYPHQYTPPYRTLAPFDKGFARYELLEGGEGWVDFEGREYEGR
ncbi:MAG: hypothetical protein EOO15_07510 [Chitinophagaceae bacterium]|nr:MAG: hypothetical protein EOO15_07510 [Chitinophagaceae bacterium]